MGDTSSCHLNCWGQLPLEFGGIGGGVGEAGHFSLPREIRAGQLQTPVLPILGNSAAGVGFSFFQLVGFLPIRTVD